jgi:catechol 2,3-dioxygenase-like lactoylglutathione lyase family enzyme
MRLTRLHQVAGRTENVATSRAFYEHTLGARVLGEFDPPGLLFLDFGGVRLLLERNAASATLYFRVDDIEAAFQALQARGVIFEGEPHLIHRDEDGVFDNPGTEEWMVFFKDPGGNTLALAARR